MSAFELASGQQNVWRLLSKLGEGDAGEVFMVEAVDSGVKAILKRPQMSVFSGDLFRQSTQIRNEAKIIQALGNVQGFDARIGVRIPYLLDQSIPGPNPTVKILLSFKEPPVWTSIIWRALPRWGWQNPKRPSPGPAWKTAFSSIPLPIRGKSPGACCWMFSTA